MNVKNSLQRKKLKSGLENGKLENSSKLLRKIFMEYDFINEKAGVICESPEKVNQILYKVPAYCKKFYTEEEAEEWIYALKNNIITDPFKKKKSQSRKILQNIMLFILKNKRRNNFTDS